MIYLKLFVMAFLWGGTFVAARCVAQDVLPLSASFLRFLVASLFLIVLVVKKEGRVPRLQRRQILPVILLGLTGVMAYNIFFFLGLKTITAGRASLIVAMNPVFIALFSAFLFKERLGVSRVTGIILCLCGALIVISHGNLSDIYAGRLGVGELYILGCVFSWVLYSLIGKSVIADLSPLAAVTYSCVIGVAGLFLPACVEGLWTAIPHYPATAWVGIIFLGFFGTFLGFTWYYEGIRSIGPSRAAVFINFVPVSGVFLGWLILDEAMDWSILMGAVLVIGGAFLTNFGKNDLKVNGQGIAATH
jgi:drug/metabolite transporter (DMT)-like permease